MTKCLFFLQKILGAKSSLWDPAGYGQIHPYRWDPLPLPGCAFACMIAWGPKAEPTPIHCAYSVQRHASRRPVIIHHLQRVPCLRMAAADALPHPSIAASASIHAGQPSSCHGPGRLPHPLQGQVPNLTSPSGSGRTGRGFSTGLGQWNDSSGHGALVVGQAHASGAGGRMHPEVQGKRVGGVVSALGSRRPARSARRPRADAMLWASCPARLGAE